MKFLLVGLYSLVATCEATVVNREAYLTGIRYVTPEDRHFGREGALLARRHQVYQRAKSRHPERWSRDTRDWTPAGPVRLGPSPNLTPAVLELKRIG